MTDPVRARLESVLHDCVVRVDRARAAFVRLLAGGVPHYSDRLKKHRADLAAAIADRAVARELLRELHAVDGETQ